MSIHRPNRANTNVRAIIANMGRSIDEARDRRLSPTHPEDVVPSIEAEVRIGASEPARHIPSTSGVSTTPRASAAPNSNPSTMSSSTMPPSTTAAPPVRSAGEMFESSGNRLKAKPKRAS